MKKYRSGHDYLFLTDNPFMDKGDSIFREIGCPYTLQWEKSYYTKDILVTRLQRKKRSYQF